MSAQASALTISVHRFHPAGDYRSSFPVMKARRLGGVNQPGPGRPYLVREQHARHRISWRLRRFVRRKSFENSDNLIVTDLPKIAVKISNRAKIPRRFQANDCIDFG